MPRKKTIDEMAVYEYIRSCAGSVPPTVREIGEACGIRSTSGVHACLCALEEKGLIERDGKNSRSIRLPGSDCCVVPIVGRVAAGVPILAQECIEGYVPISSSLARGKELFALKVKGDSMIKAGILEGDTLICAQTPTVRDGTVAVALIDDEATVKRFFREDGYVRLQPENDDYEPIICKEVTILGEVVACIRFF